MEDHMDGARGRSITGLEAGGNGRAGAGPSYVIRVCAIATTASVHSFHPFLI